jgi:hypothetical protein
MPWHKRSDDTQATLSLARRRALVGLAILALAVPLTLVNLRCSDETPTGSDVDDQFHALAGGGRSAGDDPFIGGPWNSGPGEAVPGIPDVDSSGGFRPLVILRAACGDAPAHLVIEDSTAWRQWWEANADCPGRRGHPSGGAPGDSGGIPPDSIEPGPRPWPFPVVDFNGNVVIAITLERALDDPMRQLAIEDVAVNGTGTTVKVVVYRPGEDCGHYGPDSMEVETAPAIAVQVPRPVPAPFTWERRDTTFNCSWEPDPNLPLLLYYTDADCELGDGQRIITNQDDLDAWITRALTCDMVRWGNADSSLTPPDSGWVPGGQPRDPVVPPGFTIPVDFDRFAVIVLRTGNQDRWGGGIWLTDLKASGAGTEFEYTVIEPGQDCPRIADAGYTDWERVNPTIAIRVPLPLPEPVTWTRVVRTIRCDWGSGGDSTIIVGGDSVRVP